LRTGEAEFAAPAILEHAPEAFDAAFGLRRLRGDEGDAEFAEGAAELRGLALVHAMSPLTQAVITLTRCSSF
jgi:hypothetical protein